MADSFELIVNTPDREFYRGSVTMVELVTTEGDIGVYAKHIPLTAVIAPGVLKIHEDSHIKKAAIHGGIVEILKDKVTVLAEVAEWPEEIDVNRANEARIRAERRIKGNEANVDMVRAEAALKRSLARLGAVD